MSDNQPDIKTSVGNAAKNIGSQGSFNSIEDLDKYIAEQLTTYLARDLQSGIGKKVRDSALPIAMKALQAISPNYLRNSVVSDMAKAAQDAGGMAQTVQSLAQPEKLEQNSAPDLGALNQGDIAKQALTNNNQQNGATSEGAVQKAGQDLDSVPPPAPASQPHAKEGQEMAQGAEDAAAGGEGMGPVEQPGGTMPEQIPPGQERAAKEQLGQEKQKKPKRSKKRPQAGAGQPETEEAEEDEPIIPTPSDVVASTNVSGGDEPQKMGEGDEEKLGVDGEPEEVEPEEEQEKKKQLNEEQGEPEEGGEEGGEPQKMGEGDEEKLGVEDEPEQVDNDDEQRQARDKMGEEQGQDKDKEEEKDKDKDSDDKEGGGIGDAVAGAVDDTVIGATNLETQQLLQEAIDCGWDVYGVGWLFTWPLLLFLLYLDEKDIGEFDTIFFGKLKPFKLNAFQKLDIYLQLTLAFIVYVALVAQCVMIYMIFSGEILKIFVTDEVKGWLADLGYPQTKK